MEIATWNVNSIRARLPRVLEWLDSRRPDVVCLQETKCEDAQFPRAEVEELGYTAQLHGQKTYNGVAILARAPLCDVVRGFPDDEPDADARVLGATVGDVMVLDLYVVNGQEVGSAKYAYKLEWLRRLREFVDHHYPSAGGRLAQKLVVTGDFNITFDDRDVYDPDAWRGKVLCSEPERDGLAEVMALGLRDGFRKFDQDAGKYTWWDFRTRGFARNAGLRIDHFLLSDEAWEACTGVRVDLEARGGDKPSDHAPVIASFA
ncbi:MAG: exodeoxyribonuclease III [Planctomycetes bacterium]|nr:exodeoxyribonuclease III [Planctomycetota bacterium]